MNFGNKRHDGDKAGNRKRDDKLVKTYKWLLTAFLYEKKKRPGDTDELKVTTRKRKLACKIRYILVQLIQFWVVLQRWQKVFKWLADLLEEI